MAESWLEKDEPLGRAWTGFGLLRERVKRMKERVWESIFDEAIGVFLR